MGGIGGRQDDGDADLSNAATSHEVDFHAVAENVYRDALGLSIDRWSETFRHLALSNWHFSFRTPRWLTAL